MTSADLCVRAVGSQKRKDPAESYLSGVIKPATTYFRAMHYHRPQRLNYCDRDGNRCDPLGVVTDNARAASFETARTICPDIRTDDVNATIERVRSARSA